MFSKLITVKAERIKLPLLSNFIMMLNVLHCITTGLTVQQLSAPNKPASATLQLDLLCLGCATLHSSAEES